MILTGDEIVKQIDYNNIIINPFSYENINPNSYNLTLDNELMVYTQFPLNPKIENDTRLIKIPKQGFLLQPGNLYLGNTIEYTETHTYVPRIDGRSSIGRLGIFVHVTAGFGDIGFCGNWTLEITCIHPVILYPNMKICQISYHDKKGYICPYKGKYQHSRQMDKSKIYEEFSSK